MKAYPFTHAFHILYWDGNYTFSVWMGELRNLCPWLWFGFAAYVKKYGSQTIAPDQVIMNDLLVAYARGFDWQSVKSLAHQIEHPASAGNAYRAFCDKLCAQGHFEEARECCQLWLQSYVSLTAELSKKDYQLRVRWLFKSPKWKDLADEFGTPDWKDVGKVFGVVDGVPNKDDMRLHLKSTQIFKARIAASIIDYCIETNTDGSGNQFMERCRKSRKTQHDFFCGQLAISLGISHAQWLDIAKAAYKQSPNTE